MTSNPGTAARAGDPREATRRFFTHAQSDFEVKLALGHVQAQAAEIGEVLATIEGISDGDAAGWFAAWTRTAQRLRQIADGCLAADHHVSAAEAYLRAATSYATALTEVDGLPDPSPLLPTFRAHRECFAEFTALHWPALDRLDIPAADGPMPGYLARPMGGRPGAARAGNSLHPTIVFVNGSDGALTAMWAMGASAALARGYNVVLFDGPGQQSMLLERGVPFRHDWENVIGPLLDHLIGLPGIDPHRFVLWGASQGGFWVPRTLAFEQRCAAAVVDPGVVDVAASWFAQLPPSLVAMLDAGKRTEFDQAMEEGLGSDPAARRAYAWRAKPYGLASPYDTFTAVRRYRLDEAMMKQINTPLLVTDPDDEQFWPGQSQRLYDGVGGPAQLVRFTRDEGANSHCEPMNRTLVHQRVLDWLDTTVR